MNATQPLGDLLKNATDRDRDPLEAQRAGQHADPERERSGRASLVARRQAIVELLANMSAVAQGSCPDWSTTTSKAGAHAAETQLGDGDAGEEPRQHRQSACPVWRNSRSPRAKRVASGFYYQALHPEPAYRRRFCSRSSTTRSGSAAASTPGSRRTTPGRGRNSPSRTTEFPGNSGAAR